MHKYHFVAKAVEPKRRRPEQEWQAINASFVTCEPQDVGRRRS